MIDERSETRLVVGFGGLSKSGKTSLVGDVLIPSNSHAGVFGDVVRRKAQARGFDANDPRVLLEIGSQLVEHECAEFCREVLIDGGWPQRPVVLLDGIRHLRVVETLRTLIAPAQFRLVMVVASERSRQRRFLDQVQSSLALEELDRHSVSSDATSLLQIADYVADGESSDPSKISKDLRAQIASWIAAPC